MRRTDARLHFGLTDAGSVVLRGTAFVALAALIVPAFGVLCALVSIILMALLVGLVVRPRIEVSGCLPDCVMAGETFRLRYVLKNVGHLPAYDLSFSFHALPEAIEQVEGRPTVSRLGPGDTIEVTIAMKPNRRGCYRIKQPICESAFPFNLFSFGASPREITDSRSTLSHDWLSRGEEMLIVLPVFSELQIPLTRLSRPVRASGARLAGRIGFSPEYLGNRPFLPGDSPRRIDARAWARLSVPATKEYDDDFDSYTALVLDTRVSEVSPLHSSGRKMRGQSRSNEVKELEAAISVCASVAYTINSDCLIDFLLTGPDLHQFTGWPRWLRLRKTHEILAGLEPSRGYSTQQVAPILADRFCEISEVFFILLNWDMAYSQLLELADQAGCRTKVFLIGESSRTHVDQDNTGWTGDIQFLSPDEILTGRVVRL